MNLKFKSYKGIGLVEVNNHQMIIEKIYDEDEECPAIKISTQFEGYTEDNTEGNCILSPAILMGFDSVELQEDAFNKILLNSPDSNISLQNTLEGFIEIVERQLKN